MKNSRFFSDSVIVIDKPCGHTSHEVTSFVKKITSAKRTGHAGTLDPNVSGVLPVAVGKATKLLRYIAPKKKTYVGLVKFREILPKSRIREIFEKFRGTITQTPPRMSAVRKKPRKRTIYSLEILEIKERLVLFRAVVEAGTYIRTLCRDMGKLCGGARMEELRRTSVGGITEKRAVTLQELTDAVEFSKQGDDSPLEKILSKPDEFINYPKTVVKESAVDSIKSGAQIMIPAVAEIEDSAEKGKRTALYSENGRFVGVGISILIPAEVRSRNKGLAVKLERVHI